MQSQPKKGKYSAHIKNTHTEQLAKLQHKNQQEVDLLEDIRIFSKLRSTIEKDYAQALVKLGEQFLTKRKFPPPPRHKSEDGKDYKTVWAVWKTVLEETRRVGEMRLQAAETYLQQISEPAKPLRLNKQQTAKKVLEQCNAVQKEVAVGVTDLSKCYKVYSEEEQIAHDARTKARDAEAKVNKKSTGIFTSMSKLQQNCAKLISRRETCEVKSTAARNDYLIALAAANAHQNRYYNTDLPELIKTLDGEMYEKTQEFFTTLARSELECCGLTQECFMKILTDSCMVSREFNYDCFLRDNLVFSECVQYNFEPQADDIISQMSPEYGAGEQLDKAAETWAQRVVREKKLLKDSLAHIDVIQDQTSNGEIKSQSGSEGGKGDKHAAQNTEERLELLRNNARRAETGIAKAEAVIEVLKTGGVDMDAQIAEAEDKLSRQVEEQAHQKPEGSTSQDTNKRDSGVLSESSHNTSGLTNTAPSDSTYINYDDVFDGNETLGSGGGPGGVGAGSALYENTSMSTGYHSMSGRSYPQPCMALYEFKSTNADELSLTENEMLDIIADGDGDGWLRARNNAGVEGFVPENYVQLINGDVVDYNEVNVDTDLPHTGHSSPTRHQSVSSPGHQGYTDTLNSRVSSNYSATDVEVQQMVNSPNQHAVPPGPGDWARAVYDYTATCSEELSFSEGQLIRILRRDENGVDDGFWEGEVDGRVGVFPSLVVEELGPGPVGQDGHLAAPHLAVTQPTPTNGMYRGQHQYQYGGHQRHVMRKAESNV